MPAAYERLTRRELTLPCVDALSMSSRVRYVPALAGQHLILLPCMPSPTSARIGLGIGAIMIALGLYIGVRSLAGAATPLTSKPWLDLAFAFFFIVRGGLQVRRWQQAQR